MSWQQPPQGPGGQNPYAQQPQQPGPGYGYPPQQPQAQPGGFPGGPTAPGGFPPPTRRGNPGLGILVGVVAMLIAAGIYAGILFALFDKESREVTQVGYVALGIGALIGLAVGKIGGRSVGLWIAAAAMAALATLGGELYGYALILGDLGGGSANEIFFEHFGDLFDFWQEDVEAFTYLFFALAAAAGFSTSKKLSS